MTTHRSWSALTVAKTLMYYMSFAAIFCLLPSVSRADDDTYCVGGYSGQPPFATTRCGSRAIARQHPRWHFHMWVRRGAECFACWDEMDNSCESHFLRDYPRFQEVRDPMNECSQADTMDKVVVHVIHGVDVTPKPPPPPAPPAPPTKPDATTKPEPPAKPDATTPTKPIPPAKPDAGSAPTKPTPPPPAPDPVELKAKLDRVSAGPHAAGDTIELVGSLRDGAGDVRAIPGGKFILTTAEGDTFEVRGKVQSDGTVRATTPLPTSSAVTVRFEADRPGLQPHERMAASASGDRKLTVDVCALRARIAEPVGGAALAVGQSATLRVELVDRTGAVVPAPADLRLDIELAPADGDPIRLPAAAGAAAWTPPETLADQSLRLSAAGTAAGSAVCPAGEVQVTVTRLGLGWDPSALPVACFAGLPCAGVATLVRPTTAARAAVDAALADPATRVALIDGAELIAELTPTPDDRYTFDRKYDVVRQATWRIELRTPGGVIELPPHTVDVRLPLTVNLPPELDLGEHVIATPWSDVCVPLDFGATVGALDHRWRLEIVGLDGGPVTPVIGYRNALGLLDRVALSAPADVAALDPARPILDLCLESTGCAACANPEGVLLRVRPLTPEFADQVREVKLTWRFTGRDWILCNLWWLLPLILGSTTAVFLYGWIRPHRFPPSAAIRIAGDLNALRRGAAITLVDLPGSSAGWYRDARLGLHGSGDLGTTRGAAVVLRAQANGVVLIAPRGLEQHDRRTGKWEPVTDGAWHIPSPSAIYRSGKVVFRVEV
jgi:hypothetical protein